MEQIEGAADLPHCSAVRDALGLRIHRRPSQVFALNFLRQAIVIEQPQSARELLLADFPAQDLLANAIPELQLLKLVHQNFDDLIDRIWKCPMRPRPKQSLCALADRFAEAQNHSLLLRTNRKEP